MAENEKLINAEKSTALPTTASEAKNKDAGAKSEETTKTEARQLTTKEDYFASLNAWVKHAHISQNAMALFPYYLFSSYPQIFQNQGATGMGINPGLASAATAANLTRNGVGQQPGAGAAAMGAAGVVNMADRRVNRMIVLSEQMQAEMINRNGGFEHVIAPFWKRALAELVDVCILVVLKLVVTFTVMNIFDFDLGFEFDQEVLRKSLEDDYAGFLALSPDFLALSSDLLLLELLTKVIVCFYEALWTRHGGATPGKMLLGLRIVYMEAMLPLQPQQRFRTQRSQLKALLFPAEVPGFKRSFMRAVAKNVLMTLLFPMCFMVIFFKNNRTAYDIMTKTVVIEDNPNTVLRRR